MRDRSSVQPDFPVTAGERVVPWWSSGRSRRMQRGREFLAEFIELAGIDIADRPQVEASLTPMADVEALYGFVLDAADRGAQRLADKQIHHGLAPAIDDRAHRRPGDVIEPAADQGKTLRGQVDDRRRDVELAVEPRLDGVLVAGFDVGQRTGLQRAQVRRHDVARDLLILVAADDSNDEARRHGGRQRRADSEAAEKIFPRFADGWPPRTATNGGSGACRCRHRQRRFDAGAQMRWCGFPKGRLPHFFGPATDSPGALARSAG